MSLCTVCLAMMEGPWARVSRARLYAAKVLTTVLFFTLFLLTPAASKVVAEFPAHHPVQDLSTYDPLIHPAAKQQAPVRPLSFNQPSSQMSVKHFWPANSVAPGPITDSRPPGPKDNQPNFSVSDHGGPVMATPIGVYLLYYGLWNDTDKAVIQDFLTSITGHTKRTPSGAGVIDWWKSVQLYGDASGRHVSAYLNIMGEADLGEPYGSGEDAPLLANVIANVVHYSILSNITEANDDAVYIVFTSPKVVVANTCVPSDGGQCAFHTFYSCQYERLPSPSTIKLIWIGNPSSARCRASHCVLPIAHGYRSPNHRPSLDSLINNLAQQLANTVTNPTFTSWYASDNVNNETSVICAGNFGRIQSLTPGEGRRPILYTVSGVNGRRFLLQTVFNPYTSQCVNGITVPESRCGPAFSNFPCPSGFCCSNEGWCGLGNDFCSYQDCFSGSCTLASPPPPYTTPPPTPFPPSPQPLLPSNSPPPPQQTQPYPNAHPTESPSLPPPPATQPSPSTLIVPAPPPPELEFGP